MIHGEQLQPQPYHPAAQDWLPTEAKQGWAGQYLDGRPPGKTRLLLVLVRPAGVLNIKYELRNFLFCMYIFAHYYY